METNIKKAALILATGMVLSALLILLAAHIASDRVSRALIAAGSAARSHLSAPSFPSTLRVQMKEPGPLLPAEDRDRLKQAFVRTLSVSRIEDGRQVTEVVVTKLEAPRDSDHLRLKGSLRCGEASEDIEFEAFLYEDRFGGFTGFVRTKGGTRGLVDQVTIQ